MKALILILSLASLAGCVTPALNTPHANLERVETFAENAYVQAVPFMTPAQQKIAWADLQQVRALYNSGQDLTLAIQTLMAALPKKTGN